MNGARRPIVAIDGPGAAGKTTVARTLARALGFTYLNTGAMYRAVAVAAREAGIGADEEKQEARLAPILKSIAIRFEGERVFLGGRDITGQITEPAISDLASRLSVLGAVRKRMREMQRAAAGSGGVVMEGRDIGTAVFPEAEFKFFLDADEKVRAERRFRQLWAKGSPPGPQAILRQIVERDRRDRGRKLAPLKCAPDAVLIDSTHRSVNEVVALMKRRIEARSTAQGT